MRGQTALSMPCMRTCLPCRHALLPGCSLCCCMCRACYFATDLHGSSALEVRVPGAASQQGGVQGHLDAAAGVLAGALLLCAPLHLPEPGLTSLADVLHACMAGYAMMKLQRSACGCTHAQSVEEDLSNFEESGSAWPYLLDDFVKYMRGGKQLSVS